MKGHRMKPKKKNPTPSAKALADVETALAVGEYRQRKEREAEETRENPLLPVLTAAQCEELVDIEMALTAFYRICDGSDVDKVLEVASVLNPIVCRLSELVEPLYGVARERRREAEARAQGGAS
jgi:hypothetical protein